MQQNNLTRQKAEIRTKLKQIRASIPTHARRDKAENIAKNLLKLDEIVAARTIFIYISYASEVNTHILIKQLLEQGKTLAVPKIIDSDYMLAVAFNSWDELHPGQLGILTPQNSRPLNVEFDIAITPGLGFTRAGHRIGFGRGYYDKWFAANKVQFKVALAYEAQLIDYLPIDNTDIAVDIIVTEKEVIRLTS